MERKHLILVVEDSPVLRDIESLQLRKAGFNTLTCETGEECLQIIAADTSIDAILLDIELPGISGLDVLSKVRETYSPLQLPIIMATGKIDTQTTVKALRAGANDYVNKPVDFEVAQSRMRTHLQLRDLSVIQEKVKKAEAVRALIITYNHEINNALMIANGSLSRGLEGLDKHRYEKLTASLQRIEDIVKRLQEASSKDLEMTNYVEGTKMLKI